ncbi:DEAD/DEAH box helicase family protein [Paraglaciecola aquimarina]|uniref:DEAD/DEAH box helicase family protein n=1 Tax=Paraglaciecola aquimarina TaxID=1235557 RepID=UPI003D16366C
MSDECLKRAFDKQGIYSLTVPTGGGKTFASLRYALQHAKQYKLDKIIYIIPFTSIIEQNLKWSSYIGHSFIVKPVPSF